MKKAIFDGLVFDTADQPLQVSWVGNEPYYVLNDEGFLRHIPAEGVDREVWESLTSHIAGNEEMLSEETAKLLGQEDIFSVAVIRAQLENKEKQFEALQESGFPQDARDYLGMVGFRVIVNFHGEVVEVKQPGIVDESNDD